MFDIQQPTENAIYWQDNIGDDSDGNSGFFWDRDGIRYVLLFGTYPWSFGTMDMKTNFDVWPRKMFRSSGHRGYIKYAIMARDFLERAGIVTKTQKIVLVGHSLGGAVAQYLGMLLHASGYTVLNVWTYAAASHWGRPKMVKQFRQLFPKARNVIVGWDLTQFLWVLTFFLFYGPAAKSLRVPGKGLNIIECHLPWKIADRIPPPNY
jgi:pimeloyl-ACP methyl ester carboxylesterase